MPLVSLSVNMFLFYHCRDVLFTLREGKNTRKKYSTLLLNISDASQKSCYNINYNINLFLRRNDLMIVLKIQ